MNRGGKLSIPKEKEWGAVPIIAYCCGAASCSMKDDLGTKKARATFIGLHCRTAASSFMKA